MILEVHRQLHILQQHIVASFGGIGCDLIIQFLIIDSSRNFKDPISIIVFSGTAGKPRLQAGCDI